MRLKVSFPHLPTRKTICTKQTLFPGNGPPGKQHEPDAAGEKDPPRHRDYDQNHQSPHAGFACAGRRRRQYALKIFGKDFPCKWHNGEQMAHKNAVVLRILTKANRAKVWDAKLRACPNGRRATKLRRYRRRKTWLFLLFGRCC